jgi:4-hydroxy-tetrahydrodipicolinate synthase
MTRHPLAGVYAAALTPLKSDYSLDLDALPSFLEFLARRGCHGALLLGTTGEGPSFSPAERLALWRAAFAIRELHPDFHLLAGTGTPSLTETMDLTRDAFALGFDGVVVLPPFYFRKATDDGLYLFFEALIKKAVPADGFLFGYHFPDVAGIGFSLDLLARLKDAFPKQFAGIKDSSHDPDLARKLGERFGEDMLVFNGTDAYLQLGLESHAGGCITAPANLISPDLRALWDAYNAGRDTASIQIRIAEARQVFERHMPFQPMLKALLARLHGFPCWPVRPPLVPASEAMIGSAEEELRRVYDE